MLFVGSYPPRECGIATFTRDTRNAIVGADPFGRKLVIAMNDAGRHEYAYPAEVQCQIDRDAAATYDRAADWVNESECDVVNVQHEYGLYGGEWGAMLLRFLDRVRRPVVLTLHTVLPDPEPRQKWVTSRLAARADVVVVLARAAARILRQAHDVPLEKLRFIPHGVPNVAFAGTEAAKRSLGYHDRTVLSTCGLMSPGKGIEYAITAVASLVREFPDILYVVAGETHPHVRSQDGESYRRQLEGQVRRLGLEDHVRFENRYLTYKELVQHLLASDVYVVPYLNLNQIVSGTLAYALGCGRAIVSTASVYAREVLAGGRGVLTRPHDPEALRDGVAALLRDPTARLDVQRRAYALGHSMIWPEVGREYLAAFRMAARRVDRKAEQNLAGGLLRNSTSAA